MPKLLGEFQDGPAGRSLRGLLHEGHLLPDGPFDLRGLGHGAHIMELELQKLGRHPFQGLESLSPLLFALDHVEQQVELVDVIVEGSLLPSPCSNQSTDFGDEGVVQKATGQIVRPNRGDYKLDIPHEYRAFVDRKENADERRQREGKLANFVHDNFYRPFYDDYLAAIKAGVRSVVWDNAVDVWEYVRLSVYGREATNRDDLKTEANAKFREMVRLANVHGIVLIMINHLKIKFESYYGPDGTVKWRPSSDYEMQGFEKAPFLVTASLWTKFTPPDTFELTVKKCRDNPSYVGEVFPAMPFTELMGMLLPSVENWEGEP